MHMLRNAALAVIMTPVLLVSAHAFEDHDCQLLKDLVADSADRFSATRAEPPIDDTGDLATSYDTKHKFSEAQECRVTIGKTLFNENMTCYFGDIDIPTAAAFIEGCLGDKVTAVPDKHPEQSGSYEFSEPMAGSISLWRPMTNLVLRIDREGPILETLD